MSTETIVKKTHQEEVDAYAELLSILSEEEKERIFMMIETAKILKLAVCGNKEISESKKVKMAAGMQTAAGLPKRKDDNCEKNKRRY